MLYENKYMKERKKKIMKITLKDGTVKEYESSKSVIDIAKDISEGLPLRQRLTERLRICVRKCRRTADLKS